MKIVLVAGCFDPLHVGHLHHLEQAITYGTELVVAVTSDKQVTKEKGYGRPVFTEELRAHMLKALRIVSRVVIVDSTIEALYKVQPDVFVKGIEYKGRIRGEDQAYCDQHKVKIAFTDGPTYSSTKLLRHYA